MVDESKLSHVKYAYTPYSWLNPLPHFGRPITVICQSAGNNSCTHSSTNSHPSGHVSPPHFSVVNYDPCLENDIECVFDTKRQEILPRDDVAMIKVI